MIRIVLSLFDLSHVSRSSVISLIDDHGKAINSYHYGPFGTILNFHESISNDFLFVGQWGVIREKGIPYLYRMRSRHYDAQIGRFISYDPFGKLYANQYDQDIGK
jgi:RHS repeat-associated protein